jgi:hypothetical protein
MSGVIALWRNWSLRHMRGRENEIVAMATATNRPIRKIMATS